MAQQLGFEPQLLRMIELGEILPSSEQEEQILQYIVDQTG